MKPKGLTRLLPGLFVTAGVLAAGFVTFALGGTPGSEEGVARLDLRDQPTGQVTARVVLDLAWGEDADAVWVASDPDRSTLEAVFPSPSGEVVLVDRPGWHEGSRVRWFDPDGAVVREHLAPVGSTLFAADGDGLLYVLAKSGRPSETAVVVDATGSIEATYVVPLQANTGSIARVDGEIVVTGGSSVADLEGSTLRVVDYLMPVTVDGRQATDEEAEDAIVERWVVTADGTAYGRELLQTGFGNDPSMDLGVVRGDERLQVPPRSSLLGVDGSGRVVGTIDTASEYVERRAVAGLPGSTQATELFWAGIDGTLAAVVTLPPVGPLPNARQRVGVGDDAVYVAAGGPDGVQVVRLTVEPAAGGRQETDTAGQDDDAPRLTVVAGAPPPDLNPYTTSLEARRVGTLVFRGLYRVGADGSPVPDLATEVPTLENGGVSADGRTVTYRVRDDVLWHDGEPLNSADVAFTLQAIVDGRLLDEPGADRGLVTGIEVVDDRTLVVTYAGSAIPAAWRMAPFVLPEHLLADAEVLAFEGFWRAPVGSGPYRVAAFVPGTEVALEPVSDTGASPIDVVFTADIQAARRSFDGAPRAIWLDPPLGPASDVESYDQVASIEWSRLEFNHRPGHDTADPAVRQALTLLMPTQGPLDPGPYGPAVEPRVFDAAGAAAVLDAAGWRMGEDGVRSRDGETLRVHFVAPPLLTAEGDRIEALLLEWEALGIAVRFTIPGGVLTGSYYESRAVRDDEWDVAWIELPVGVPSGWASTYVAGDEPSWERPYALNISGVTDPDGPAAVAWGGARTNGVLAHGVTGASAEPVPTQALLGATGWRPIVDAAGGDDS